MNPLYETVLRYRESGLNILPVKPGNKMFSGRWKQYQEHMPTDEQIEAWFKTSSPLGVCVITGEISGEISDDGTIHGLEILDCDDSEAAEQFIELAALSGLSDTMSRMPTERTPGGGMHWAWRCSAWEGSLILAQRDESKPGVNRIKTLIETRGEGAGCAIAPTPTGIHPISPDRSYHLISGSWIDIPIIDPDNRTRILDLARTLNTYVKPSQFRERSPLQRGPEIAGERPGDFLNATADRSWWQELLERHGWSIVHQSRDIDYWQRPGKQERDKTVSATLGACGPYFYVFSSNATPFDAPHAYKPFAALALLDYGGDFKACAQALQPKKTSVSAIGYEHRNGYEHAIDAALADAIQQEASQHIPFDLTEKLKVRESLSNYVRMFSLHPQWKDRLSFNLFARRQELDHQPLVSHDRIAMGVWASSTYQISGANRSMRDEAIFHVSMMQTHDPLFDYIHHLQEWDGQNRLSSWMPLWCGSPDNAISAWIGKMLITQMIVRGLNPGCIARYVVVLEGAEGSGKSQLVMTLGHPWAITFDMSMDQKEAHMAVQGAWVAELSELDTLRRTTETRLKSFIAQSYDNFVPKYSNDREDVPRRCVFIGTTNEENYLVGETGNTRFLPIKTGKIKLDEIARHREQLFAEAKIFFESNERDWWKPSDVIEKNLFGERDERRILNVYEHQLGLWLDGEDIARVDSMGLVRKDEVTWHEIAQGFLQIDRKDWKDKSLQSQIASALRANGWGTGGRETTGRRAPIWKRR